MAKGATNGRIKGKLAEIGRSQEWLAAVMSTTPIALCYQLQIEWAESEQDRVLDLINKAVEREG